ncbi:unnamed protein product [Closterium sp. NIES-54]
MSKLCVLTWDSDMCGGVKHCPESTLIVLPHECPYCCRYTVFRAAPLARSSCPAPPAIALPCPAHDRAALPCPQSRCLLPSALPARERASCPRAPLRPCPLALPASSLRPVVCCYCCHLRGPSCYMRCCYYLLLLLSATAAAEHAAVATAAASIPAAVPELLLPNALLLLLLLQVVLLLRLSCCRYPRCLHVPSPRAAAAAAVRRLLRAAAAATCCSCRSLLLLLLTAAAFAATAIAPCPARAVSPCRAAPPCQFAAATAIAAAATTATAAMANFSVLMFDAEWLMRDATARNHLPVAERASESAAFDETLHTFTLDSGASRCFFRDCTTLTPLAAPVPVSLADPTGGPKVARASTVLPCPAIPSDSLSGLHLPTFSTKLVSNATLQDVWTLLWHHRLGHPSLPRLRSMHSRLLVSGLPRSLPSLPRSPAPPCLPCVEGRQRAAPHSSKFPPTTAPLQTLHMDDLPVLRLHSDRGGEFSFDLLAELCQDKGIHRTFTLPTSPQQNGIAERRFSLIMELNLWPRVSLPETSPTLRWMGQVGDASVFRVLGALSLVCDTTASKLSPRTLCCIFLGFPIDAPPWQFYHSSSRRGPAPSGVSQVDPPPLVEPLKISSDSFALAEGGDPAADDTAATRRSPRLENPLGFPPRLSSPPPQLAAMDSGDESAGAGGTGVASLGGTGAAGAGGARAAGPGGPARAGGAGGAAGGAGGTRGASGARGNGAAGAVYVGAAGAGGAGGAGGTVGAGGTRGATSAGGTGATSPTGPRGAGGTTGAGGTGAAGAGGARGAGAGAAGAGGAGGAVGAGGAGAAGAGGVGGARGAVGAGGAGATTTEGTGAPTEFPNAGTTSSLLFPQLLAQSPLPALAPYTAVTESLTERPEPETRASTPELQEPETRASVRARVPRVCRSRAPAILGTHDMTLCPSSVPQRVVLPSPPASSLPAVADPPSDLARASSPTVTRFLTTVLMDPKLSSPAASALVAKLVDFAAAYRLDYLASLVSDPDPACPPSVGAMDAEMASWNSTSTYVNEVPPPGANIVSGMWIFRVKRPPGSPPAFKGRYVARGFSQREEVDFFHTFSPTPKITTLQVLLHVAAKRDYQLHSLEFSTTFLQDYGLRQAPREWHDTVRMTLAALGFAHSTVDPSLFLRTHTTLPPFYVLVYVDALVFATADTEALALVKAELQERHTCVDLGEPQSYLGLQITWDRARHTITLTQSHMAHQVHWDAANRVLRYLCITSGMGLVLGGRGSVVLTGHSDASWADDQATQRSSQGYTFSLGSGSISWRSTRSSSVLGFSCEAEIYAGAMAAQELRWLTYLLTDLGERPCSPPVLYVNNKAMLALCHEQRLEHTTKHIALRYFLARELHQRRQLRLSYVASQANTADVFTKALGSGDHQRFCTALGLVPTLPHLLVA